MYNQKSSIMEKTYLERIKETAEFIEKEVGNMPNGYNSWNRSG